MIILGIETSCDDTGVAIIRAPRDRRGKIDILSNLLSSQAEIHRPYGGVYPHLARRAHQENLPILFEKAHKEAGSPQIDLIAATRGPGLEPCLWIGANFVKTLQQEKKIPVVPVNHLEAHLFSPFIESEKKFEEVFPALCLIVSGGNTQLIFANDFGEYELLGETRDDAAGECIDKVGRLLGLGYPAGPLVEKKAARFDPQDNPFQTNLPRPMIDHPGYDFSFSGLKTAALYHHQKQEEKTKQSEKYIEAISAELQQAIIDVLIAKTMKAAEERPVKSIILGGGVTANQELRRQFSAAIQEELESVEFFVPSPQYSTDNALMIAATGYFHWLYDKKTAHGIEPDANLSIGG